ncbi:unnamed protein product [Anisakis simplex]|uniref:Gap associated protein-related (inferred by orthology to a S. mansoni protein) n=1 Tax=Anisakis simplex TaxID=6269 RepID=A0A0M3J1F2_ANISI|nr:unnamed protein product [Anisakis simplex]
MPGDDYLSESTGGGRGDYYQGNYGTGGNVDGFLLMLSTYNITFFCICLICFGFQQSMKGYQQYGGAAGYSSAQYGSSGYTAGYGATGYNAGYGGGYQSGYSAMEAQSPLDAEIQVVIREIHTEQQLMEQGGEWGEQFKNAKRLLAAEADKLENSIDPEWLEVDIPKPIKVSKKILIPNFRHPRFNFVGKILGPKGASLQAMAKQFKCHIYVLGRGSTKDRAKEQELLASGDPQYAHYGGPLHVKVETIAPAHTAYQRIAGVLETLSQILQPVHIL